MISTTLFPGRYVQGADSIKRIGVELSRFGQIGLAICTPYALGKIYNSIKNNVDESFQLEVEKFNRECSDEEIDRLTLIAKEKNAEIIIGIGGGKTLDTAKVVAYNLELPVAIIPTIATSDAPCSALSVIYTKTGEFKRYLILPRNPDLVLIDTKIIAEAPTRLLVAGMGDALATWFEADACKKSFAGNMTGNVGSKTAFAIAELCYNILMEYGVIAKSACDINEVTPALEYIVEANTLLSGIGFESGGLATAHAIHNGLTALKETHNFFHGEKVAIGTLASLFLTNKPIDTINKVFSFCENIGLPTTLEAIGLPDISDNDLVKIAETTCNDGETIYNEPIDITPEKVFIALKTMDKFGKSRKTNGN